jgi:cyclopropane fatty-acyl-phospholipid synthase-like methyltransferase
MTTTDGYRSLYEAFDSDLMRTVREEAYGEDIGQHLWVTAEELRADIRRLGLTSDSSLLDLGCGPGGPLVFVVRTTGCVGTGLEMSAPAIASGQARAQRDGVDARIGFAQADLDLALPVGRSLYDAAMSLDVVLHLRDRRVLFERVARVLRPNGRLLFTDAGVVSGPVSSEEFQRRGAHGFTQFVPAGFNERSIAAAGLRLIESEERTASVSRNARGRLGALEAHRAALEQRIGKAEINRQQAYLETVAELSERGALSRWMYLAQQDAPKAS